MKTLKYFNSLQPELQCAWIVNLLDDASLDDSSYNDVKNIIQEGEKQGENKDNFVKLLLLLEKSIKVVNL